MRRKDKRCGCSACVQICPRKCIYMYEDSEGFLYPRIDKSSCSNCGLCLKVCPYNIVSDEREVHDAFAFVHNDKKIHMSSSSGGAFSAIANDIIKEGGLVYGATFDTDFNVVSCSVDKIEDLYKLRGSKYVQCDMKSTFLEIRKELKNGRQVLFCGTPCQVKGLHGFLMREYPNLITVDFACHAISSPKVWRKYVNYVTKGNTLSYVNFRNKDIAGWNNYALEVICKDNNGKSFVACAQGNNENIYMRGFLENLYCRPSCSNCPARNFTSLSDITIADFWHVESYHKEEELNKNDGISLLLSYNTKSGKIVSNLKEKGFLLQVDKKEIEIERSHRCLIHTIKHHELRKLFFFMLNLGIRIDKCISIPLKIKRIIRYI